MKLLFWKRPAAPTAEAVREALKRLSETDTSQLRRTVIEAQDPTGEALDRYSRRITEDLTIVRAATPDTIAHIREQASFPVGTLEDFYWGRPSGGTEEDYLWRRLSDNWYQKDILPSTYLELHNQCYEAYQSNPLAKQSVEIMTNMIMGRGTRVVAKAKPVQKVIDDFWRDTDNHMDTRIYALCTELALYGEQFIRFFVNPFDGKVKIGQMDPSTIDQIVTDPNNVERALKFHQRPIGPGFDVWGPGAGMNPAGTVGSPNARSTGPANLPTIDLSTAGGPGLGAVDPTGAGAAGMGASSAAYSDVPTQGRWFTAVRDESLPSGEQGPEVVQFAVNKVSNAKRGTSDLACILVWLRRYKDWLTDRVRINKYKGAFLWDVNLKGADKNTVDRKQQEYAYPPSPGSVIVHNDNEEWEAIDPRIGADRVSEDGKQIKMMIAVGAGLPEHYLAEGGNVNKATASEMNLPTQLKFERRQDYLGFMLHTILDRVLDEAIAAGTLRKTVNRSYEVVFPPINLKDGLGISQSLYYLAPQLAVAVDRGWMTDLTAMKLLHRFLGGDAFDVTEEYSASKPARDARSAALAATGPQAPAATPPTKQRAIKIKEVDGEDPRTIAAGLAVYAQDTGRTLMIQRSIAYPGDPAAGRWEFPGGCLEPGEVPLNAAKREWAEETGCELPEGIITHSWLSANGVYRGFLYQIRQESAITINLDHEDRHALNPDDPDGDDIETMAWWDPRLLPLMPGLRDELKTFDWSIFPGMRRPASADQESHPLLELAELTEGQSGTADIALLAAAAALR